MAENRRSHSKMDDCTRKWKISQKDEIPFRFFGGKSNSIINICLTLCVPSKCFMFFKQPASIFHFVPMEKNWYSGCAFPTVCRVTPSKQVLPYTLYKFLKFLTLWNGPVTYQIPTYWAWLQVVACHLHSQGALCWWTCYSLYSHGRWQKLYIVQVSKPLLEVLSKRKNQTASVATRLFRIF